jgi:hypothetical protein
MPKGPRGEKRPADVIGNAVKVMRIAGEEEEDIDQPGEEPGRRRAGSGEQADLTEGYFRFEKNFLCVHLTRSR